MLNKNTLWSTDGVVMRNGCNAHVTIEGSNGELFSLQSVLTNDYPLYKQFDEDKVTLSETAKIFVKSVNRITIIDSNFNN